MPVGTIFSVVRKITRGARGEMEDMLQPGRRQVAAGYVIYGSSTMLVYTTGQGAHGFTLDPSIGEFLLSHPNIRIPERARYPLGERLVRAATGRSRRSSSCGAIAGLDGGRKPLSVRYVGSLVADFHRNLLGGGVFCYPANRKTPNGKLRLLYEANPLAFIVRAGRRRGDATATAHPRRPPDGAAPAHAALHRQQDEVEAASAMLAQRARDGSRSRRPERRS